MEFNLRYFERRALQEAAAARVALTDQARDRRLLLAAQFRAKADAAALAI